MLLEFTAKNYKSFKEKFEFSMIPAPKQKGLDYSIMSEKIGRKTFKGLSSAIIYGPNASGKTNIIGAMDTMRSIVMRGNIKNTEMISLNAAANKLELIPFCSAKESEPVEFAVKFIEKDVYVDYSLILDIGIFLDEDYERSIIEEKLLINGKNVFIRNTSLELCDLFVVKTYLNEGISENLESAIEIAKNGLNSKELFLTNNFKAIFSKKIVGLITDWFENKFIIIYRADSMQMTRKLVNPKEDTIYVEKTLNEAATEFGINSNALGFKPSKEGAESVLFSIFGKSKRGPAIPAEMFESYGTIRFVNEFPLVIYALLTGATLVVDEFDASIHPMALMNIINIFHNDDINKYHAQLIFNTHNPIFLNANLYRRDEIKFVERDDDTHESTHYSLSDFKTSGMHGVRKGEDYMKNYFISQYGAIKDVDFSPILEALIVGEGENIDE